MNDWEILLIEWSDDKCSLDKIDEIISGMTRKFLNNTILNFISFSDIIY